jgi:hypothetical protein
MTRTARRTLSVLAELERRGCRITAARLLPCPAVRVDRAPAGIDTWGYREPPRGTIRVPTEHVATLRGVRITWFARPPAGATRV